MATPSFSSLLAGGDAQITHPGTFSWFFLESARQGCREKSPRKQLISV